MLAVFDSGLKCTNMAYILGLGGIEQNSFAMQWYAWALTEYYPSVNHPVFANQMHILLEAPAVDTGTPNMVKG